jgi:hypothetical protein
VCVAWALPAAAQQTIEYASISGRVVDEQEATVVGAAVTARHVATNVSTATITDDTGRFRFPLLRPGPYELHVRQGGFRPVVRTLTLTIGSAFELPITLLVGGVDETVTVSADAAVLETARSQIGGRVAGDEVRTLPLNGRQFLELAVLVPGVAPTNIASTQLFPETSAVPGISL